MLKAEVVERGGRDDGMVRVCFCSYDTLFKQSIARILVMKFLDTFSVVEGDVDSYIPMRSAVFSQAGTEDKGQWVWIGIDSVLHGSFMHNRLCRDLRTRC